MKPYRWMAMAALAAFGVVMPMGMGSAQERDEQEGKVYDVKAFTPKAEEVGGPDWSVEKLKDDEGNWKARFVKGGAVIKEFGHCGDNEAWMRFLMWPPPAVKAKHPDAPELLVVLRYGGGAHGPEYLDIVKLDETSALLLETDEHFNFQRVEDLDDDGWPEVIGVSRKFAYALDLDRASSPFPALVLSYDKPSGHYLCQNHRFPELLEEGVANYKEAFEMSRPVGVKVSLEPPASGEAGSAFAPLFRWIVELCYMGDADEGWQMLKQCATTEAAKQVRETAETLMNEDRYYQEMKQRKTSPKIVYMPAKE